ncbi:hypothetical protein ACFQ21_12010 [Ohtaekwangia kribbensis]|uniref:Nucleotide modification associated domain-containing protein n=1 Tax=Ohtaekwangia kribbensis TaxID=688913 RepID=A0ABW3K194_9BACT
MTKIYIYVVDRDIGFAPNPFFSYCTLATCKPKIRNTASIDDWVIGVGGRRLKATGKCIYAMKVSEKITFNEYWNDIRFRTKRPVRNGSKVTIVGDNIYHFDEQTNQWHQAHSHHSLPDGSLNEFNLKRDTLSKNVLISNQFYYFGTEAPTIPAEMLEEIQYINAVGHRVYRFETASKIVAWIQNNYKHSINQLIGFPFELDKSESHYSVKTNRMTKATISK